MRRLAFSVALVVWLLTGSGCSGGEATVVLTTDMSPLTASERTAIEAHLGDSPGDIRDLELVGRVISPHGVATLVTFSDDEYDECWAVIESRRATAGCGSVSAPPGTFVVGDAHFDGFAGLVVDTSQPGITGVRLAADDGRTYEVPRLAELSYITFDDSFEDPVGGYVVSLVSGDEVLFFERR